MADCRSTRALLGVVVVALGLVAPQLAECQDRRWLGPLEEVRRISDVEGTLFGDPRVIPDGFAPGHAFMHTSPSEHSRHLWSSKSRRVETPSGVYEGIDGGIVAVRQAANAPDGEAVVYHRWSDVMILLASDGSVRSVVWGIEAVEFPDIVHLSGTMEGLGEYSGHKVDPKAVEVTLSAAVGEDRIFVLFVANRDQPIVDAYSRDGEYAGSYRLPDGFRTYEMAVLADGSLAFLDISFVPAVVIMRRSR